MDHENHPFNIKLMEIVKKYPCLWRFSQRRNNDELIAAKKAWKAVSKEMSTPVDTCRRRWTNIRKEYQRKVVRSNFIGKVKKDLDFLAPFARKKRYQSKSKKVNDDQDHTVMSIASEKSAKKSNRESQNDYESSSEDVDVVTTARPNLKRKQNDNADDDSGIFVTCTIRKKEPKVPVVDANQSFLNSLLPYLREMTGKQNRRFRKNVVALIDEILEDADIPQVLPPTSYPVPSPALYHPEFSSVENFRGVNGARHFR